MTSEDAEEEEVVKEGNEPPKVVVIENTVQKDSASIPSEPAIPMPAPPPVFSTRTVNEIAARPSPRNYRTDQPMYVQQMSSPTQQPIIVSNTGSRPSILAAYILWFFLGWAGVHHLYLRRGFGVWILSVISGQGCGIWWIVDFFLIPSSCSKVR